VILDRRFNLNNILTTRNKLKNARNPGNQACSLKQGLPKATIIPVMAKEKRKIIMVIKTLQAKFESYQGVMVFLKDGFWSNCIYFSFKYMS
jgi:hypothetical protein